MNLIEELGLEKCKAIVEGASELDFAYDLIDQEYLRSGDIQDGYSIDHYENCIVIDDLRTAIATYDCDHDFSVSNPSQNDKQIDLSIKMDIEDNCTDIRNHISPNTKVIEL